MLIVSVVVNGTIPTVRVAVVSGGSIVATTDETSPFDKVVSIVVVTGVPEIGILP